MAPVVHARGSQARGEERQEPRHDPQAEIGPQRSADAAPPAEGGGGTEHAERHSGRAERDRVGADGGDQRRPQGGEDEQRQVIGGPHRALESAANVPERESIEGEMQRILVQQIRGEQAPRLSPVEDQRGRLGAVQQQRRECDAGSPPCRGEEDADGGEQQADCHPRNTADGERLGRRRAQNGRIGCRLWKSGFFRPRRHLL